MNQDEKRTLNGLRVEKEEKLRQLDIVIDRCRKDVSTYLRPYLPLSSVIDELQIDYALSAMIEMRDRMGERKALVDEIENLKKELA
jgi:hypothetical protein